MTRGQKDKGMNNTYLKKNKTIRWMVDGWCKETKTLHENVGWLRRWMRNGAGLRMLLTIESGKQPSPSPNENLFGLLDGVRAHERLFDQRARRYYGACHDGYRLDDDDKHLEAVAHVGQ